MATKTGFKITSDPLAAKDTSRKVVAKATQSDGRTTLQQGTRTDHPEFHYASKLESKQQGCGQYEPGARTIRCDGPPRNDVNHSNVSHANASSGRYHSHMGASKAGHRFPGRRV